MVGGHLALDVRGVSVDYGATRAIAAVDLQIEVGEVVAVIGPSGCGKSTLLRAVAGFEPLAAGTIFLDGVDLADVATHRRELGLMFQEHALFPHLDVAGNVAFGLEMRGAEREVARNAVSEALELVGLSAFAERSIESLSGGEAQRVALARAIAPSPSLLMLDEPLGSLDRVLREQLTEDIGALVRELGMTTVHVTHDQAEAFALADRVVVLRAGAVEQVGAPAQVWAHPESLFVAEFVGHPNRWTDTASGHTDVVPITALSVCEVVDADVVVRVESTRFRQGRFENAGVANDGRAVTFESVSAPGVGESVGLRVDAGAVVRLPA